MNANEWQATAEIVATVFVVVGSLAGIGLKLLQTRFVTRGEHELLCGRLDTVETGMGETVKKKDLDIFSARLHAVEAGLAENSGLQRGTQNSLQSVERLLNIVIDNGLNKERA